MSISVVQPSELCSECPFRHAGVNWPHELKPINGAMSIYRLAKGQVVDNELLSGNFTMIRKGSLKAEFIDADGRAEIAGFLLSGEPVVLAYSNVPMALTALEETWLCKVGLDQLRWPLERNGVVLQKISDAIGGQASGDQMRMTRARSGPVEDRVFWFLCDLAGRQQDQTVNLTMSRQDIAHYLATTAESVSRAISVLARDDRITKEAPRRIRICRYVPHAIGLS